MLFVSEGMPILGSSLLLLFEGTFMSVSYINVQIYICITNYQNPCTCLYMSTVLNVNHQQQADPRELFIVVVGEHFPQWQIQFSMTLTQTSKCITYIHVSDIHVVAIPCILNAHSKLLM